jgi:glycosyltransferase involved in cell wall biosynthesis
LRDELLNELGFSASSRVLIYVGRWDSQKDPLRLLRAFRALLAEDRDIALVLFGDGVLRGELQAFVRSHGLDRRVALSGPRPQPRVADWLRAADLFVLSSAYEGMPMSVLEALGSGLPVATTDVGEVRRVVRPGVNGEIAGSRSVEDLVRAMADCLDRLDLCRGPVHGGGGRLCPTQGSGARLRDLSGPGGPHPSGVGASRSVAGVFTVFRA